MSRRGPLHVDAALRLRLAELLERTAAGLSRASSPAAPRGRGWIVAEALDRLDALALRLSRQARGFLGAPTLGAGALRSGEFVLARPAVDRPEEKPLLSRCLVSGAEDAQVAFALDAGRAPAARRAYLIAGRPITPEGGVGR